MTLLPMAGHRGVVALTIVAAYICLIDRMAISIAIIPMVNTFNWSPQDQGAVMSAFFLGYVLLQLPAGWLSDRVGGKWVLGTGVVLWSVFTLLTPPAAAMGLGVLLVCRFLMGVAESVTWPAAYNLFTAWVPPARRGFAIGMLNSAISGGTIIALLLTSVLIEAVGWQAVFYVYGVFGIIWAALWFPRVPNSPVTPMHTWAGAGSPDMQRLLAGFRSAPVLAMVCAHFCSNWVIFLSLAWTPTLLIQAFDLKIEEVGIYTVVPFLVSVIATPLSGRLSDYLIGRGVRRLLVRKAMQSFALFGMGAAFLAVGQFESITAVITVLCLGNLAASACVGGFAANLMDLAPDHSATLLGASNAIAALGSASAVYVAGVVLQSTGAWSAVFQSAALVAIVGGAVFLIWADDTRQM